MSLRQAGWYTKMSNHRAFSRLGQGSRPIFAAWMVSSSTITSTSNGTIQGWSSSKRLPRWRRHSAYCWVFGHYHQRATPANNCNSVLSRAKEVYTSVRGYKSTTTKIAKMQCALTLPCQFTSPQRSTLCHLLTVCSKMHHDPRTFPL